MAIPYNCRQIPVSQVLIPVTRSACCNSTYYWSGHYSSLNVFMKLPGLLCEDSPWAEIFQVKKNWKTVNVSSNNICFHCDHQQRLPYEEKQKTKNYFIDFVMAFPFMNGVITTNIKTFSSRKVKPVHFSDYSFGETWNNCSFQQSKFKINIC